MMRQLTLLLIVIFLFGVRSASSADLKKNVLLILADDLGWSDTTLYGTTTFYKTPNIERLAKRGMLFTHAYASSPLCSPTRSSILTGLSPARTGITTPNCHLPKVILNASARSVAGPNQKATIPISVSRLNTSYYTLAEMFRDHGYATAHFGKWHLGSTPYSPLEHGFDIDIPHWPGPGPAGSYVAPWKFPDFDPDTPNEHIEDRMAREAVAFMEEHQDVPFYLNYWMFSVHAPFDAKQDLINAYKKSVNPENPQRSPTYAAMIESMDDAVGTLIDTLDRLKIAEKTIIVFASDNGGNMYNEVDGTTPTSNAPLRGGKATMYEGGIRGPAIIVDPGVVKPGSQSDEVIQSCDYYPTLLELLSIKPQSGQVFDGISIVPALLGKHLPRRAIFTYFPHSPGVPDWLPPSVSVHQGDWKLIRIFHGGDNGQHRWKLFNLRDDIGEQHDLSAEYPEKVAEMDALIEEFLNDTNAVRPKRNPNFDPSKYRPELEGISTIHNPKRGSRRQKPVAGWSAGGTCQLSLKNHTLIVASTGGDPYISFPLASPVTEQPLVMHFSMASDSSGQGQFFWREQGVSPPYFRDRSQLFDVQHDGSVHEYQIEWSAKHPVTGIRIDPSTATGTIRISDLKLTTDDGRVLYRWKL